LKRLIWKATTSTCPQQWERDMRMIKKVNVDAFKHLMATPST